MRGQLRCKRATLVKIPRMIVTAKIIVQHRSLAEYLSRESHRYHAMQTILRRLPVCFRIALSLLLSFFAGQSIHTCARCVSRSEPCEQRQCAGNLMIFYLFGDGHSPTSSLGRDISHSLCVYLALGALGTNTKNGHQSVGCHTWEHSPDCIACDILLTIRPSSSLHYLPRCTMYLPDTICAHRCLCLFPGHQVRRSFGRERLSSH